MANKLIAGALILVATVAIALGSIATESSGQEQVDPAAGTVLAGGGGGNTGNIVTVV